MTALPGSPRPRRSRGRRLSLALLFLALLLAAWSFGIEPRWVAQRELEHAVPGWAGSPGLKVAVASDWHVGRSAWRGVMTAERARAIVAEINAARPDVVLLPGDFISDRDFRGEDPAAAAGEIARVLGGLKAPLGVFAVLGNHDWWHGGPAFMAALKAQGIAVLENAAAPLEAGVWVVGVGDHSTGHSDPGRAFAALPARAQALVLMHDPASLPDLPPVQGLVVAGHTHGGQVWLPGIGALVVPGAAPKAWAHGWVSHGPNTMYVTSGLGTSILPVRFNKRPEWLLFRVGAALG